MLRQRLNQARASAAKTEKKMRTSKRFLKQVCFFFFCFRIDGWVGWLKGMCPGVVKGFISPSFDWWRTSSRTDGLAPHRNSLTFPSGSLSTPAQADEDYEQLDGYCDLLTEKNKLLIRRLGTMYNRASGLTLAKQIYQNVAYDALAPRTPNVMGVLQVGRIDFALRLVIVWTIRQPLPPPPHFSFPLVSKTIPPFLARCGRARRSSRGRTGSSSSRTICSSTTSPSPATPRIRSGALK